MSANYKENLKKRKNERKRMRVSCPNCHSNKVKKFYTYLKNDIYEEKLKIFYKKKVYIIENGSFAKIVISISVLMLFYLKI